MDKILSLYDIAMASKQLSMEEKYEFDCRWHHPEFTTELLDKNRSQNHTKQPLNKNPTKKKIKSTKKTPT